MIAKFNEDKYNDEIEQIKKNKSLQQSQINKVLSEGVRLRINDDDYYDCLEKETLHKLKLHNIIKEKTLKDKMLNMQRTRNSFAESKIIINYNKFNSLC